MTGTLNHCCWECKTVWHFKDSLAVSYKTELGIYPELKTYAQTKTCIQMTTAALFVIVKTWKQTRCSSVGDWVRKLQHIHTTEDYSAKEMSYQVTKRHGGTSNAY